VITCLQSGGRNPSGDRSRTIVAPRGDRLPEPCREVRHAPSEWSRSSSIGEMDVQDPTSAGRSSCPLTHGSHPEGRYRLSRNQDRQNGSKRRATARLAMLSGTLQSLVQAPRLGITLDLPIPLVGHEFLEPLGKDRKLLGRKLRHGVLDFLNAHVPIPTPRHRSRQSGRGRLKADG